MKPLEEIAREIWPWRARDSHDGHGSLRWCLSTNAAGMPTYGVSGIAIEFGDVRAHLDAMNVWGSSRFSGGLDFYYRFLKSLTRER